MNPILSIHQNRSGSELSANSNESEEFPMPNASLREGVQIAEFDDVAGRTIAANCRVRRAPSAVAFAREAPRRNCSSSLAMGSCPPRAFGTGQRGRYPRVLYPNVFSHPSTQHSRHAGSDLANHRHKRGTITSWPEDSRPGGTSPERSRTLSKAPDSCARTRTIPASLRFRSSHPSPL